MMNLIDVLVTTIISATVSVLVNRVDTALKEKSQEKKALRTMSALLADEIQMGVHLIQRFLKGELVSRELMAELPTLQWYACRSRVQELDPRLADEVAPYYKELSEYRRFLASKTKTDDPTPASQAVLARAERALAALSRVSGSNVRGPTK